MKKLWIWNLILFICGIAAGGYLVFTLGDAFSYLVLAVFVVAALWAVTQIKRSRK